MWHLVQVRERARIGARCTLGKNAYVDAGVVIGDDCKVENNASLFAGVELEDMVFIGPHACLTNDRVPRATTAEGAPKGPQDWTVEPIRVERGASVGAGSVILAGVTVGRFALVGAGSVVTRDVAAHSLVVGNPARHIAYICVCGQERSATAPAGEMRCPRCRR